MHCIISSIDYAYEKKMHLNLENLVLDYTSVDKSYLKFSYFDAVNNQSKTAALSLYIIYASSGIRIYTSEV